MPVYTSMPVGASGSDRRASTLLMVKRKSSNPRRLYPHGPNDQLLYSKKKNRLTYHPSLKNLIMAWPKKGVKRIWGRTGRKSTGKMWARYYQPWHQWKRARVRGRSPEL